MKFVKRIVFCLFLCFGAAFSQDSSFVPLSQDSSYTLPLQDSTLPSPQEPQDSSFAPPPADSDTVNADSAKIKPGLHFFVSAGVQFINFKEHAKFQALLDSQYNGASPQKQDFQAMNLAFPLTAGIIWQFNDMHSLGLGAGFLYDNESVILADEQGEFANFSYTLQAFPIFMEYRLQIPPNFISIKDVDYFSLFLRYYWMLPGTEVYSSWGKAEADFNPLGNGFGIFLGYRFWEFGRLSILGEMGYLSLNVKSSDKNGILDSWNLGGISISIKAMF